jgi:hypothetical protein
VTTDDYHRANLSKNNKYFWKLKAMNTGGESDWSDIRRFVTGTMTDVIDLPDNGIFIQNLFLNQNNTVISLECFLNSVPYISIGIYNYLGFEVFQKSEKNINPGGKHTLNIDISYLPSGLYICYVNANNHTDILNFLILR